MEEPISPPQGEPQTQEETPTAPSEVPPLEQPQGLSETTTTQWEFLFPIIEKESFTKASEKVRDDLPNFLTKFAENLDDLYEAIDQNPCRTWGVSSSPVGLQYPFPTERTIDEFFENHDDEIVYPIKLMTQFIVYINEQEKHVEKKFYPKLVTFGETVEVIKPPHETLNTECDIPMGDLEEMIAKLMPTLKDLAGFLPEFFSVGQRFLEYLLFLYSNQNPFFKQFFMSTILSSCFAALGKFFRILHTLTVLINDNMFLSVGWEEYRKMILSIKKEPKKFNVQESEIDPVEQTVSQIHRIVFNGNLIQLFFNVVDRFAYHEAANTFADMLERYLNEAISFYIKKSKNAEFAEHEKDICDITLLLHFLTLFRQQPKDKGIFSSIFNSYQITPITKIYHNAIFSQVSYITSNLGPLAQKIIGDSNIKATNQKIRQYLVNSNSSLGVVSMKMFNMFSSWQCNCQTKLLEGVDLCHFMKNAICRTIDLHQSFSKAIDKDSFEHIGRMLELLKAVQYTFFLNQSPISHNLPKTVDIYLNALTNQAKHAGSSLNKRMYKLVRKRACNIINLAIHCIRSISSKYSSPCLEVIADLFSSKTLNGLGFTRYEIIQSLRNIDILQHYNAYIDNACNCSFLIDSREIFAILLKSIIETPRRIIFLAQAMNDIADMVKDDHELYLKFEKYFNDLIRENFISPILSQIEEELRFHTHEHLSVSERNPFKKKLSDFDKFLTIPPFRIMTRFIDIQYEASYYFSKIFYKETTVAPQVWETYSEMANMAHDLYGISILDCHIPGSMVQQDIDVLEIMRNISLFVACYNYDLNSQIFVQRAEDSHYISIVGIPHIFSSYRCHGIGIMNTTVDFTYRFLRMKFNLFSRFLFDENVKSKLINDISWFEGHKDEEGGLFPYSRAEKFVIDMKRFAENAQSLSPLDKFRILITEIGNALGFVRMVKSGGIRYLNKANGFVYDEDQNFSFYEFAKEVQLPQATMDATEKLDSIVGKLKELFNSDESFFKMLVDVFSGPFRNKNASHLQNFYAIIPALTLSYIEHILQLKDNAQKQNKNSSFSDDGFPLGVAYILKLLDQDELFDTLHWFDSLTKHAKELREEVKNNGNKSKYISGKSKTNAFAGKGQTQKLALQLIEKQSKEYQLLETTVHSARILFN